MTGLRGIAALWVVGYHCHKLLPGAPLPAIPFAYGFLGVDVFFVLSGYMLASLYADIKRHDLPDFWLKRVLRIYPLHLFLMACLGTIALGAMLAGHDPGPHYTAAHFLAVASLLHVPLGIYGWNDPTWSISVEMCCYLAFPLFIAMATRPPRAWLVPLAAAALLADIGLVVAIRWIADESRLAEIAGWSALARGGLGFFVGCALSRFVPLGTMVSRPAAAVLASRPVFYLGEISFSLYLIHQPILLALRRLDPWLTRAHVSLLEPAIALCVAVAVSHVTYAYVEVPGRRLYKLVRARRGARPSSATPPSNRLTIAGPQTIAP